MQNTESFTYRTGPFKLNLLSPSEVLPSLNVLLVFQVQSRGTSRQFSETMLLSGMYRDHGFNTSMDRSRVTGGHQDSYDSSEGERD
uniref:Uncharacterized protein n=1 Tax=Amphiprion percula TaxID=161767 RepID=A0A3P8UBE3_AMPPE